MSRFCPVLVVVALGLLLSACGEADGEATATSAPTASAATDAEESTSTSTTSPDVAATVTTMPERETTTTTAPEAGSLEEPIPVGQVVQVGDWRIRVSGVTADGTEQVLEENQFNEPPEEGRQFFITHLEATYTGTESSNFWVDMSLKVVGPSNVAYESFEDSCGVIPESIDDSGETFPGGSIAGNACWSVTEEDARGLILLAEETLTFDETRAYLSLDPQATPIEASTGEDVGGSSRLAEAVPVGEAEAVGPWTLTVTEVTPDATELVLAENQFNEPPGQGEQFYMAAVEASYNGEESSTFWVDMTLKAVGDSSVAYEGFDGSCGVIPDALDDAGETFPGGTIEGNVCWKVRADDVGSLVMIAEESFSLEGTRVYFSLTPG